MRGRRRSPGPPGGFRRDDRRNPPPGGPRDRRRRSFSPDRFRRGGSPPPFKKGRYGREYEDFPPPPRGYDSGFYGRPSPPPSRRDGPRTYKDFCRTLPDDVTPEEAQKEYQQYLAEYWGSEVRADFEAKKNEEWTKRRFDPRRMREAMNDRNEEARKAASSFRDDLKAGILDPKSEDFNQGMATLPEPEEGNGADEAPSGDEGPIKAAKLRSKAEHAPSIMWKPARIQSDLVLSLLLLKKLDQEKGIEENPLSIDSGIKAESEAKAERKAEGPKEESKEEKTAGAAAAGAATNAPKVEDVVKAEPAAEADVTKEKEMEMEKPPTTEIGETSKAADGREEDPVGTLDLRLVYLWRVHGVDYYGSKELHEPSQFAQRLEAARVLRGPRPEAGEQGSEAEEKKSLKLAERRIDQLWKKRLVSGDPFAANLHQEKAEKLLEDWVEDQVKKIADNKWGCKLSQKLFVGRDYVVKHVKLKHTEKVEEQRNKILDEIFFENYKKFRDEEQKLMQAELARVQQAVQMQQGSGGPWEAGMAPAGPGMDGFGGGFGSPAVPVLPRMGGPMMPQRQVMMPGMMPGPGQMLVLAPGAGPMGPFVSVPIAEGMAGRGVGPPRGPPMRGPPGGRGFMGPPFGGGGGGHRPNPQGMREYFDLDNPSNNRAVLDYGDL